MSETVEPVEPRDESSSNEDEAEREFKLIDAAVYGHYCLYSQNYQRLKEMRKFPKQYTMDEIQALENQVARATFEIDFARYFVGRRNWPTILHRWPPKHHCSQEQERYFRKPISQYQIHKVQEIDVRLANCLHRMKKLREFGAHKAVELVEVEIERITQERESTLRDIKLVPNMSANSPGYDPAVLRRVKCVLLLERRKDEAEEKFQMKLNFLDSQIASLARNFSDSFSSPASETENENGGSEGDAENSRDVVVRTASSESVGRRTSATGQDTGMWTEEMTSMAAAFFGSASFLNTLIDGLTDCFVDLCRKYSKRIDGNAKSIVTKVTSDVMNEIFSNRSYGESNRAEGKSVEKEIERLPSCQGAAPGTHYYVDSFVAPQEKEPFYSETLKSSLPGSCTLPGNSLSWDSSWLKESGPLLSDPKLLNFTPPFLSSDGFFDTGFLNAPVPTQVSDGPDNDFSVCNRNVIDIGLACESELKRTSLRKNDCDKRVITPKKDFLDSSHDPLQSEPLGDVRIICRREKPSYQNNDIGRIVSASAASICLKPLLSSFGSTCPSINAPFPAPSNQSTLIERLKRAVILEEQNLLLRRRLLNDSSPEASAISSISHEQRSDLHGTESLEEKLKSSPLPSNDEWTNKFSNQSQRERFEENLLSVAFDISSQLPGLSNEYDPSESHLLKNIIDIVPPKDQAISRVNVPKILDFEPDSGKINKEQVYHNSHDDGSKIYELNQYSSNMKSIIASEVEEWKEETDLIIAVKDEPIEENIARNETNISDLNLETQVRKKVSKVENEKNDFHEIKKEMKDESSEKLCNRNDVFGFPGEVSITNISNKSVGSHVLNSETSNIDAHFGKFFGRPDSLSLNNPTANAAAVDLEKNCHDTNCHDTNCKNDKTPPAIEPPVSFKSTFAPSTISQNRGVCPVKLVFSLTKQTSSEEKNKEDDWRLKRKPSETENVSFEESVGSSEHAAKVSSSSTPSVPNIGSHFNSAPGLLGDFPGSLNGPLSYLLCSASLENFAQPVEKLGLPPVGQIGSHLPDFSGGTSDNLSSNVVIPNSDEPAGELTKHRARMLEEIEKRRAKNRNRKKRKRLKMLEERKQWEDVDLWESDDNDCAEEKQDLNLNGQFLQDGWWDDAEPMNDWDSNEDEDGITVYDFPSVDDENLSGQRNMATNKTIDRRKVFSGDLNEALANRAHVEEGEITDEETDDGLEKNWNKLETTLKSIFYV